ncbi:class II aldolase/adducin family protein [Sinorhizobium psoraleae]|uniref:class II aldolase/adducin family protein n=1 Tax=Sinorhizobium psoraleae TaxID=520838 RepID=UPI0035E3E227
MSHPGRRRCMRDVKRRMVRGRQIHSNRPDPGRLDAEAIFQYTRTGCRGSLLHEGLKDRPEITPDNLYHRPVSTARRSPDLGHNEVTITPGAEEGAARHQRRGHTHAPYAVSFSPLSKRNLSAGDRPRRIDLLRRTASLFGTTELITTAERGRAIATTLGVMAPCLLQNHGIVTAAASIEQAILPGAVAQSRLR